jgi:hypothetical protein
VSAKGVTKSLNAVPDIAQAHCHYNARIPDAAVQRMKWGWARRVSPLRFCPAPFLIGIGPRKDLDPYSTTFARRDGVGFGLWQGARRARCSSIVTDKQRWQRSKAARPKGVDLRKPLSVVACLRVAPLRDCTALLVSGFLRSITACKCDRIWV